MGDRFAVRSQGAPRDDGTINWGIFKRHFGENYSGINTARLIGYVQAPDAEQVVKEAIARYGSTIRKSRPGWPHSG